MNKSQQKRFETLSEEYEGARDALESVVEEIVDLAKAAAELDAPTPEMVESYDTLRENYLALLEEGVFAAQALADFGEELGGVYLGRSDRWQESDTGQELIQFAEELEEVHVETYDLPEVFDVENARQFCVSCEDVPTSPI